MKKYWKIGEVAELLKIPTSTIRFWETEFGDLHEKKNRAGDRLFTIDNVEKVYHIWSYLYEWRFTIEGARRQMIIQNTRKIELFR